MAPDRIALTWYFDFVSPFAYLQLEQLDSLPKNVDVVLKPVVLGALLAHWQQKGPAEIPGKRTWTYRYAHFRAEQLGIPFRMPPAHPFNPIRLLRLALVMGASRHAVGEIFRFIWRDGRGVEAEADWVGLCKRLGRQVAAEELSSTVVKTALRHATDEAIGSGVFGVPTFVHGSDLFWGEDATAVLLHCLKSPQWLRCAEITRISQLPVGVHRA